LCLFAEVIKLLKVNKAINFSYSSKPSNKFLIALKSAGRGVVQTLPPATDALR
jgi:hypothetical protein